MPARRRRPRDPRPQYRPRDQYSPDRTLFNEAPTRDDDPEIWAVHDALQELEISALAPDVIRGTFDQIYDGQRTGRWDADQLNKTEKTHIGTLLQINLQKELELVDGADLDYKVAGVEVDCKWSRSLYGWEIPIEMYARGPRIALVVWGSDYTSRWAVGLIRTSESVLKPPGKQRDQKRQLSIDGRRNVLWLGEGELVENTLLHLSPDVRKRILDQRSGQQSVNSLFRELPGTLVNRATVLTVAQQDDCLKRVRDARKHLRSEGYVIFGHYTPHPALAEALDLARPTKGRFVSARLAPLRDDRESTSPYVEIQGGVWRLARDTDPPEPAPTLPSQGREAE